MYDARELTVEQIGQVLGVSRTSIYRALAAGPREPDREREPAARQPGEKRPTRGSGRRAGVVPAGPQAGEPAGGRSRSSPSVATEGAAARTRAVSVAVEFSDGRAGAAS